MTLKSRSRANKAAKEKDCKECLEKLMDRFRSLLGVLVAFSAKAALFSLHGKSWSAVSAGSKMLFISLFVLTAILALLATILSHSTAVSRKLALQVSLMTRSVCVGSLLLFHLMVGSSSHMSMFLRVATYGVVSFGHGVHQFSVGQTVVVPEMT